MKLSFVLSLLISFYGLQAQAKVLDCKINADSPEAGGWVTERYYFEFEENSDTGSVYDAVTEQFEKGTVPAKVVISKGKKVTFSWQVITKSPTGQLTKMIYRAALFLADDSMTIRAAPGGYDNAFEAVGKCELGK
jgi:hypothetical protein